MASTLTNVDIDDVPATSVVLIGGGMATGLADATGGVRNITLPAATEKLVVFTGKADAGGNAVNYAPAGADTIIGGNPSITSQGAGPLLLSDGVNQWYRIGNAYTGGSVASPFLAPLGAVGAPGYAFTGDTDTGWWSPGANIVAGSTNGAERIRIDASGKVGIGRSSSGNHLEVNGAVGAYGAFVGSPTSCTLDYYESSAGHTITFAGTATNLAAHKQECLNFDVFTGTTSPAMASRFVVADATTTVKNALSCQSTITGVGLISTSGAHTTNKGLLYASGTTHAYLGLESAAGSSAGFYLRENGAYRWGIGTDGGANLTFYQANTTAKFAMLSTGALTVNGGAVLAGEMLNVTGSTRFATTGSTDADIAAGAAGTASVSLKESTTTRMSLAYDNSANAGSLSVAEAAASLTITPGAAGALKLGASGDSVGFFGTAGAARPSAYTQTYSTADKTHAARTYSTPTTSNPWSGPDWDADKGDVSTSMTNIKNSLGALAADQADTAQLLNSVIDDLQALGILQ